MPHKTEQVVQMAEAPAVRNDLTSRIFGAAMEARSRLGPVGFLTIFQRALALELRHQRMNVRDLLRAALVHRGQPIGEAVIGLVVYDQVVFEPKAVDDAIDVRSAQLANRLRHGEHPLGLPLNSRVAHLRRGLHRRINGKSRRFARSASSA